MESLRVQLQQPGQFRRSLFSNLSSGYQEHILDSYGGEDNYYEATASAHRAGFTEESPWVATGRNLLTVLRTPDRSLVNKVILRSNTLYLLAVPPELTRPILESETEVLVKAAFQSLDSYVELALPNPFRNINLLRWIRGGG